MTALHDACLPERFWVKVQEQPSGCWGWTGRIDRYGYAQYSERGQMVGAHRVSYTALCGPIPTGLQVDHLCRNRACVNPDHLEPVTQLENARRGAAARKTHCVNGHAFTPENTYRRPGVGGGRRSCRECNRQSALHYRAKRSAS